MNIQVGGMRGTPVRGYVQCDACNASRSPDGYTVEERDRLAERAGFQFVDGKHVCGHCRSKQVTR